MRKAETKKLERPFSSSPGYWALTAAKRRAFLSDAVERNYPATRGEYLPLTGGKKAELCLRGKKSIMISKSMS